jgi:hypothetical protein
MDYEACKSPCWQTLTGGRTLRAALRPPYNSGKRFGHILLRNFRNWWRNRPLQAMVAARRRMGRHGLWVGEERSSRVCFWAEEAQGRQTVTRHGKAGFLRDHKSNPNLG